MAAQTSRLIGGLMKYLRPFSRRGPTFENPDA